MNRLFYISVLISAIVIFFGYFILWLSGTLRRASKFRKLAFHFALWFSALLQIAMLSLGLGQFLLTAPFYYFIPIILMGSITSAIVTVEVIGTVAKSETWTLKKRFILLSAITICVLIASTSIARIIRIKHPPILPAQETTSRIGNNILWLNNTIWEFSGGEMEASKIIFRPDGNLIFEGGFASLNPSYWQYDEAAQELYFIVPKVTDEMLENRIKRGRGEVKRVDRNNRSLIYDFDSKTEVFDFIGWNFSKKREY
jgi:hypothetical protein